MHALLWRLQSRANLLCIRRSEALYGRYQQDAQQHVQCSANPDHHTDVLWERRSRLYLKFRIACSHGGPACEAALHAVHAEAVPDHGALQGSQRRASF